MANATLLRQTPGLDYTAALDSNLDWAMSEGGRYFSESSEPHKTLRKLTGRLESLGIPYALIGGLALYMHGFRRFTEDVDLLVTRESLDRIHANLRGRGFLPPFDKSKNLRDTENGVKIDLVVTGGYPGDGLPKPISFPDPAGKTVELNGIRVLDLKHLIELKLASGTTGTGREQDLVDVTRLIREASLPLGIADDLDPSVRDEFIRRHGIASQSDQLPDDGEYEPPPLAGDE